MSLNTCERPVLCADGWRMHVKPRSGEDSFAEHIMQHVLDGHSAVQGAPGTGKSTLLRKIRNALVEGGEATATLAPSNAAARLVEGSTVHAFIKPFRRALSVDERVSHCSVAGEARIPPRYTARSSS